MVGVAEEPVEEEVRVGLDQDQKQFSDLGGGDEDKVVVRRQRIPVQRKSRQNLID